MISWKVWPSLLLLGSIAINAQDSGEVIVVPGVYEDPVEETPIFYTSYVPIIFEFEKPNWKDLNLSLSGMLENCTGKEEGKVSSPCPTGYYLREITENLSHIFSTQLLSPPDPSAPNSPSSSKSETANLVDSLSCEKISPHFKGGLAGEIDAESYFSILKTCPYIREGNLVSETLNSTDMSFLGPLFDGALDSFNSSFTSESKDHTSTLLEFYTALKGILLGRLIIENDRWNHAFSACARHQLPRTMINESYLLTALKTVSDKIINYNLELSVPLEQLNKLYDLTLTDCSFTTRQTFLLRLLIPVKSSQANFFRLCKLYSLPSIYKNDVDYKLCEPTNIPRNQVHEISNNQRYSASCQDNDSLCYVSLDSRGADLTYDHSFECTKALAKNDPPETILKYCKSRMQCSFFDTDEAPYYRRLTEDTVFISVVDKFHFSHFNISVWCKNGTESVFLEQLNNNTDSSEFLITLPCDCEVRENKHAAFLPSVTCKNSTPVRNPTLRKLNLPDFILQPKYLLPNESAIILTELKSRMQKLEVALQEVTEQSLNALSNRGLYVALVVLLLIITVVLFLWGLHLWRRKRSILRSRTSYVMFDQTGMLQEDDAL